MGGKLEWLAHALPVEGAGPHHAVAGDVVEREVTTCGPQATLDEIGATIEERDVSRCVIVNDRGIVVGQVRRSKLDGASGLEEVLEPGPATVQLTETLGPLAQRMEAAKVDRILVTTPKGVLLGEVLRSRARAFLDSKDCCEPGRHPRR